ncbi:MAG: MAPEG family protein [Proteobacteria bacterium]|nr:MAPEG family protein [Pseudomonadota bacterium]
MTLEIVPIYAALLGLLYFLLSGRAIDARRRARRAIGLLGEESLDRRLRAHANFAEYAPFILLLLAFAELRGASATGLHLACVCLVLGRSFHAWGVSRVPENFRWRMAGMIGTFTALAIAIATVLKSYL